LDIEAIGPIPKPNIFAEGDWTGQISLIRLGNFLFTRGALERRSCAKIARRANQFGDDDGLLRWIASLLSSMRGLVALAEHSSVMCMVVVSSYVKKMRRPIAF
jgi:hypothetical protein